MSKYKVVLKADHNFVMALCGSRESAESYIAETLPRYVAKGYLMDKTLKATDFEALPIDSSFRSVKIKASSKHQQGNQK